MPLTARDWLSRPGVYQAFLNLIGAKKICARYVADYIRPQQGASILDLGCGTGHILGYLPHVRYVGLDIDPACITVARHRYAHRGTFICGDAVHGMADVRGPVDIVMANGLLHHLEDPKVLELLQRVRAALAPMGRLVTLDGCYTATQSRIARYLLTKDRGSFVRTEDQYVDLARRVFACVRTHVHDDLLRIPYTHIVMDCWTHPSEGTSRGTEGHAETS